MTDRELLELAAKAAFPKSLQTHPGYIDGVLQHWAPLEDDGDALRLAVRMSINIVPNYFAEWHRADGGVGREYTTEAGDDVIYAETRRAIVRAAAEIGKAS